MVETQFKAIKMDNFDICKSTAHLEAVLHAFFEAETDIELKGGYELAGLRSCALKGYETIVQPVLGKGFARIQVSWIILYMDITYRLLSKIDVNMLKYGKETALFTIVKNCGIGMVHLLLKAGSDVNLTNDHGQSVLQYCIASFPERCDIIQALLRAGAEIR